MSDSEGGGDLFGDEAGSAGSPDQVLSDQDLGSDLDDGENRERDQDRDEDNGDEDQEVKVKRIMGVTLHRHRIPRTSKDGSGFLQTLKIPSFLKLQAEEYKPDTYEATEWDIQNARSDKRKNVVRFTRDPETGELKSNALIYRWDDGSVTMSVGAEHYEIQKKIMAPGADKPHYEERDDAHYYVAAAHFTSELFVTVGHVNEQYTVNPPREIKDEAILKFNIAMEEAQRAKRRGANMIFTTNKDPELQKREAEAAEKERMKAQRRRENASARIDSRAIGSSVNYKSGLSIGELEGGRRGGISRKRGAPGASKGKRRRADYDSDDDFASGAHRRNEYDREDDFIASSDEEEEGGGEDDEEEEDLLDDDEEEEVPRKKRQKTAEAEEDADADADADLDDVDVPAPAGESSHRRRRHIIDDEDDEE
ncbi:Leo1-like protein-domain-containing protein [Annulohypoxylon truncatum]|uniref:Leo1-like protein-domain-containing protein n=1 Tax=Annulohypoxylon truncatum TaxID=327061 RepID=UPI0020074325|nr:Leo1-like protein-domain-containing protein [Annulohypoxylon truncatum]KAI1208985.1 Leo1-like protein-domain-containing protein [Annulohypoxylon truncatum]